MSTNATLVRKQIRRDRSIKAKQLLKDGWTKAEVARCLGIAYSTIYSLLEYDYDKDLVKKPKKRIVPMQNIIIYIHYAISYNCKILDYNEVCQKVKDDLIKKGGGKGKNYKFDIKL